MLVNRRYVGAAILGRNIKDCRGKRNSHRRNQPEDMLVVEGVCPRIISDELFSRVQARMEQNRHRAASHAAKRVNLLAGKVFCGVCGSAMTGTDVYGRGRRHYHYYRCARKERIHDINCKNKMIRAERLEAAVLDQIYQLIRQPEIIGRLVKAVLDRYAAAAAEKRAALCALESRKTKLERSLDNLYAMVESAAADAYDLQRMARIKQELTQVQAAIADASVDSSPLPSYERVCAYIKDKYYPMTIKKDSNTLKSLVEAFVDRVTVYEDTVNIKMMFCAWMVCPVRVELTHLAPEASALSTELRAQ